MLDFQIQHCTRRCARTGQQLQPGDVFYSVLVPQGGEVVRLDYSEQGWEGPPEGALGWWKSQIPSPHARKIHWAPNDVMLHYFEQLEGDADKQDVRYVLALLLVRRRVMQLEETEQDASGREVLVLYCPRNENQYKVAVVLPTGDRVEQIQNELAELLMAKGK